MKEQIKTVHMCQLSREEDEGRASPAALHLHNSTSFLGSANGCFNTLSTHSHALGDCPDSGVTSECQSAHKNASGEQKAGEEKIQEEVDKLLLLKAIRVLDASSA